MNGTKTRTQLLNTFYCTLNDLNDAATLKKNGLTLSDYNEIISLFFVDIAQNLRLNAGRKISVKTAIKPVADYYKNNGFDVTPDFFGLYTITL